MTELMRTENMAKRNIKERLSTFHGAEKFDKEFWRDAGHEVRFAAAWEMIAEVDRIRGKHACESRLQRTVQNIQRRER